MTDYASHVVEIKRLHAPLIEALEGKQWHEVTDIAFAIMRHSTAIYGIAAQEADNTDRPERHDRPL